MVCVINPDQIVYGSPGHGFDNAQKCGGVKPMDGIPTILDNWISSSNADKTKNEQIRFHSHRPYAMTTYNKDIIYGYWLPPWYLQTFLFLFY
jgi:hypothetical protein